MKTIKVKLPFTPEITIKERKKILKKWAKALVKNGNLCILEEDHLERMSYIVIARPVPAIYHAIC